MIIKRTLSSFAKKATSIITLSSLLGSALNIGLVLPVKAQDFTEAAPWEDVGGYLSVPEEGVTPLATLQSFINSPSPSECNTPGACDEYTNVSYVFKLTNAIQVDDLGGYIKIALNTHGTEEARERWNDNWPESAEIGDDLVVSGLPAGINVTDVSIADGNLDQNLNTLEIELSCVIGQSQTCEDNIIDAGAEITVDLKNNPLIKPNIPGPVLELVMIGSMQPGYNSEQLYIEKFIGESKMTVNSYTEGLIVTANVDARLTFEVQGLDPSELFEEEPDPNEVKYFTSEKDGCNFGTIVPQILNICIWRLFGSTNAPGGMQVYVVQDDNMRFPGSGAEIEQFNNGEFVDWAAPEEWTEPLGESAGGANAHLGYTSDDEDIFANQGDLPLIASISTISGSGEAATAAGSMVADSDGAGDNEWLYGNILQSTVELEQAVAALGQSYGHTQYFIVVGNF